MDLEAYGPEIAVRFLKHAAITEEEVTEELSDEEEILERMYQTPITWTKKSKWLSYSRIINWG